MNTLYDLNPSNLNNCPKVRRKQVMSQSNPKQKLAFKGDYGDFFESFSKIEPEKQKKSLQDLLKLSAEKNLDLVNNFRNLIGLKQKTEFNWMSKVYELDLSEHTAEEFSESLFEHILSCLDKGNTKVKVEVKTNKNHTKENEYCLKVNKLKFKLNDNNYFEDRLTIYSNGNKLWDFVCNKKNYSANPKDSLILHNLSSFSDIHMKDQNLINLFKEVKYKIKYKVLNP